MKGTILAEPEVREVLKEFVFAELYTDRESPPELKEIDERNLEFQRKRFVKDLPLYVTLGPDGEERSRFRGLTRDKAKFLAFLKKGLDPQTSSK